MTISRFTIIEIMFLKILKAVIAFFVDFIETGIVALSLFLVMYIFLFQPHRVKGNSMLPNFFDSEFLLTNKITYNFRTPQRGDVIIFKAPANENDDYIKRVIGLPGETVMISQGQVYLNNHNLDESSYLSKEMKTTSGLLLSEGKKITIPEGHYLVLGDNRGFSSDSRDWGTVPKENIIGKAWLRYWPLTKIGLLRQVSYSQF